MAIQYKVESLDDIDPSLHSEYTKQDDGTFVLSVTCVVSEDEFKVTKEKVKEFRDNNISLQNELKIRDEKLSEVDMDRYREFLETERKLKDKKLIEEGNVEEIVNHRIGEMKDNYTNQLSEKDQQLLTTQQQLHKLIVTNELQNAAAQVGAHPTAIADIISRGEQMFTVKDGKATAVKDGEPVLNKEGEPLSINQFMEKLTVDAPHLFQGATGANTNESDNPGPKTVKYISKSDEHKYLKEIVAGTVVVK